MQQINNPRIIRAWTFYDWANSVYSLVIVSSVFPVYYQAITTGADGSDQVDFFGFTLTNSVLLSYAISFSFILVTPILPLLSGIADFTGKKKQFMKVFVWIGGLACCGLYFFTSESLEWGIICLVLASIGYSGSVVFYDAFLPEIVSTDMTDRVSARGFTMGYIGSILLLVFSLVLIQGHQFFGFSNESAAVRFVFLLVGIWWIAFAQIPLRILPDSKSYGSASQTILLNGYRELRTVWNRLTHLPQLKTYLLAYFFFNMGVQTVMYLAATFGSKELELPGPKLIATVLLIQLVGAVGAFLFARLSGKIGNKRTLTILISVWIIICFIAYFINKEVEFYAVAFLVGIVMGGIQSLSRATYSKLIPADTHDFASFFSFYDVVFNISIVMGTFTYGLIEHLTGSMRNSTLVLMVFFVFGLIFLSRVRMSNQAQAVN